MRTGSISESTNKGRHVNSHRELIVLDDGGIFIDNPGMREVGIVDLSDGLNRTFEEIIFLSRNCKYKDCSHTNEAGCAIIEAVEKGEIDRAYDCFMDIILETKGRCTKIKYIASNIVLFPFALSPCTITSSFLKSSFLFLKLLKFFNVNDLIIFKFLI